MKDGSSVLSAQKEKWGNGTLENCTEEAEAMETLQYGWEAV